MRSRTTMALAAVGLVLAFSWLAIADTWHCPVASTAAESAAGNAGAIQNLGQTVIDRSTGGPTILHAGVIPCYQLTCRADILGFTACIAGPMVTTSGAACACHDRDGDGDADLADFALLQAAAGS